MLCCVASCRQVVDLSMDLAVAAFIMKMRMGRFSYPSVTVSEVTALLERLSVRCSQSIVSF
jgi:hypothetical protein